MIREPDEVSKIVLEKEANGLEHLVGGDVLNDHNMMQEIRFCSTIGGYSGPYQFSAASLGKTNFSALWIIDVMHKYFLVHTFTNIWQMKSQFSP